ncbi:hypothetical protein MOOS6835_05145 [Moraxella osloensis]|uniref:Uncharacterized protein n=1 Tax=Faucicola osloensis TaxID=34062 RepID=A0A378Q8W2_FAUOS|nr:Uncharacterised protein [Moraxella osloensis]VXB32745.1 conserved hypothetical protein [Enhydrobacter sp. AX1]
MTMELPTASLPQANTIGVFNKNVLKDSMSVDLWANILR